MPYTADTFNKITHILATLAALMMAAPACRTTTLPQTEISQQLLDGLQLPFDTFCSQRMNPNAIGDPLTFYALSVDI